jgi:hypothetical protein
MSCSTASSPLLRLPRELRYEIYDHLCRQEPKSYPFRQPPISSIDQRAPPTALYLTCRYIHEELQGYFHGKVTIRFVAQGVHRIQRKDIDSASLVAIRQAKKIELRLQWHITPTLMSNWSYSMHEWLAEQIDLLLEEAKSLELITLSVMDASNNAEWASKTKSLLAPLKKMAGRVRLRVGEVVVVGWEGAELMEQLAEYVKEFNEVVLPASSS